MPVPVVGPVPEQAVVDSIAARLRRESDQVLTLLEAAEAAGTEGWFDYHIDDNVEFYSDNFWRVLNRDPREMGNSPDEWRKHIHPEDLDLAIDAFGRHIDSHGAEPYDLVVRYSNPDGGWLVVRCWGEIIEWDGDKPVRMVGTHTFLEQIDG